MGRRKRFSPNRATSAHASFCAQFSRTNQHERIGQTALCPGPDHGSSRSGALARSGQRLARTAAGGYTLCPWKLQLIFSDRDVSDFELGADAADVAAQEVKVQARQSSVRSAM